MVLPYYRGAFDAGLQVNTVRPEQLFGHATADGGRTPGTDPAEFAARRPVLLVPAYYTARDADLTWLTEYARAGGHLVLGPRAGYGDHEGRARVARKPAGLAEAAGAWYQESANLTTPVQVHGLQAPDGVPALALPPRSTATLWADYLIPEDARPLVAYDDPHLQAWPVITTRAVGAGRVTTVGTIPDQGFARALLAWLVPAPCAAPWTGLPEDVRVTSAQTSDGRRVWFIHHWGWGTATLTVPIDLHDATHTEQYLHAGVELVLDPWDVRILIGSR